MKRNFVTMKTLLGPSFSSEFKKIFCSKFYEKVYITSFLRDLESSLYGDSNVYANRNKKGKIAMKFNSKFQRDKCFRETKSL